MCAHTLRCVRILFENFYFGLLLHSMSINEEQRSQETCFWRYRHRGADLDHECSLQPSSPRVFLELHGTCRSTPEPVLAGGTIITVFLEKGHNFWLSSSLYSDLFLFGIWAPRALEVLSQPNSREGEPEARTWWETDSDQFYSSPAGVLL